MVAAIAVFVCAAVYLNWNYEQEVSKTLGESAMVGKEDPLVDGGNAPDSGTDGSGRTEQTDSSGTAATGGSYFDTARLNRQQSRDSALALLQEAAGKESADQTLKDEANASIQTMADYTVTEAQIENLVIAKGYTDCVAFIGENALSLAVAAPEGGLTDADTARIVDVVNQTAGFSEAGGPEITERQLVEKAVSTSWRSVEYVKKWRVTVSAPRRSGTSPGRSAVFYTRLFSEVFFKFCFVKFRSFSSLERDLEANVVATALCQARPKRRHRGTAITEQKMGLKISSTSRPKGGYTTQPTLEKPCSAMTAFSLAMVLGPLPSPIPI